MPSGWDKFKRPELRAVTGAVFTSIQQQLLAGASGLDVTLLHKALVELSDTEGDDGSPPIRSPAFQKATQAARVALAAAAPTPAEGFTASAVFGSSHHLERVVLQAAVLPWLQREVWRLIYDLFCLGCLLLLLVAGRASLVNNKGGVMAVRACALISCALLQAWTSSLLTWHSLTNHVSLSLLELAAVHAASRLSGLQLHLVQAAWQAVLLHSSQHSELLGIDSLIMKCGICGSQIMVLILARDTPHWAVRVLSSSSVPAHLPINWLEGA